MSPFNNKTVLITGAATGVGEALAHEIASRGGLVYVTALSLGQASKVSSDIKNKGFTAFPLKLDVTNYNEIQSALDIIQRKHGCIDYVINNAGVLYVGEFHDMEESFIESLVQVNFTSVMVATLYAYRMMKEQGKGHIINIASQGGLIPVASMAAYSGTKHGVVGLTASVEAEARSAGIDFSTVCFGFIKSKMLELAKMNNGAKAPDVKKMIGFKPLETENAAVIICNEIERKKRLILLPKYTKVMYFLQRMSHKIMIAAGAKSMERFRNICKVEA